ncbi:hypothetical protein ACI2K4_23770 [Micromonospora sp. NPDC050397]|uniref:hypothetical protein n=1 Tax=Micromonospora sp. NPDC050397 TaxID=3364279 RepID=UPI00384A6274
MHIMRKVAAGIALGAVLALGAPAVSAQAATQASAAFCGPQHWQDQNTYGARCIGGDSATRYYARVLCTNGRYAIGPTITGSAWSYAYCTKFGGNVHIAPGAYGEMWFL